MKIDEQLSIPKAEIIKKWRNADNDGKKLLEAIYGQEIFESEDVTLKIKTVEDAFKLTGRPKIDFSNLPKDMREKFEAEYEMNVISEAINEGWIPDWDNDNQPKWRPWFIMSPSGFAFDVSFCAYSAAYAGSGSRLHFETREKAIYVAKQFLDIWKKIQLG
ncbi:hypothetical protein D0T49_03635 [Paludibacter sp. 221]|uniref:hypothetical protein n=1 Tax=Paludibacter sp. 221 TaxID=2302939 RepID=UPI0013D72E76|nr:hypothetical protein [Paludibacter sp. 221]NDV46132.1 hypothetical protein [Paludibacter sp. 221]